MAEKKIVATAGNINISKENVVKNSPVKLPLFEKENYMWMIVGAIVVTVGMLLMSGGKNENASQFDYKLVYSFRRITIAPILILIGLMVEIYAIFKRPKVNQP